MAFTVSKCFRKLKYSANACQHRTMKLPSLPLLVGHNQETEDYRLITHEIDSGFLFWVFFNCQEAVCTLEEGVTFT